MSRSKNWWWEPVRRAIISYPALKAKKNEAQSMSTTPAVVGITVEGKGYDLHPTGGGGGNGRKVERLALMSLPPQEEQVVDAVETALEAVTLSPGGQEKVAFLTDYWWHGKHRNMARTAGRHFIEEKTGYRWNAAFIRAVAVELGYLWPYKGRNNHPMRRKSFFSLCYDQEDTRHGDGEYEEDLECVDPPDREETEGEAEC